MTDQPPAKRPAPLEPPPPSQAQPIKAQVVSAIRPAIPFLTGSVATPLSALASDYHVQEVVLDPAAQTRCAEATYETMQQLVNVDLAITQAPFTRMWRTLILKRSQDVYEKFRNRRAANYVRLGVNTLVPAPLGDVLYGLGSFYHADTGIRYYTGPPAQPADVPNWWVLDNAAQNAWDVTMARLSHQYLMREFPAHLDHKGRTLFFCSRQLLDDDANVSVKTHSSVIDPVDGLICGVNENLFNPVPFPFVDSHLEVFQRLHVQSLTREYTGSYILSSNS